MRVEGVTESRECESGGCECESGGCECEWRVCEMGVSMRVECECESRRCD